jgi:anaerobic ribonucleoside-triphosphate reductase
MATTPKRTGPKLQQALANKQPLKPNELSTMSTQEHQTPEKTESCPIKIMTDEERQIVLRALKEWREEGDAEEQRESFELLAKGIDENRPYRKLFS